ncbi:bacterial regulatory s, gntR family protein [Anoxybacillus sp. B7M1]|uniref:MocR-like pyridoxine biosynthesis transcription factor PdxR n=1 Tax=unclassified Anoxybacillus TaxID=2639704 RepID=UPI0007B5CFDD|nr:MULTISPECIES: PLP-dependent aminotransferase family protein [unclassified Anoxybacillus]ANB56743.1 bacterial regulatory s, gntR family protein [Anoxybacillus sp. B2M1]ANB64384.1 bacterial regulatory s, gntR family protein [Anoxybacillus sp. B7M1]
MIELTPHLDSERRLPLYEQLYEYIKGEMVKGHLQTGEALPSIRVLAKHLRISRNTVEAAYAQLVAEGYVESRPRKGFIIKEFDKDVWMKLEPPFVIPSSVSPVSRYRYDFRYGHIDTAHFPLRAWRACLNEAMDASREELLWYGERQGERKLRQQIARYLFQARSIHCSDEQVIIGAGIHQITGLLCQLFSPEKNKIAMENPSYDGIRAVFINHRYQVLPISLEQDGLHIAELEQSDATVAYVTPSHQLPLGMVLPIGKRQKLLKWAETRNAFLIEDDYDSEFRYEGKPIPALKALDTQDRVIYIGTFSKVLTPAIRVCYMILPKQLLPSFYQMFSSYHQPVATVVQKALALFMEKGYLERHIRKMRTVYAKKRQTLIHAIYDHFGEHATIIGEKAGLHLLVHFHHVMDADRLVKEAKGRGIHIYSVAKYWFDSQTSPPPYILLGFGSMTEQEMIEAIQLLKDIVQATRK